MKPNWKEIFFAAFMGLILPGLLLSAAVAIAGEDPGETQQPSTQPEQQVREEHTVSLTMYLRHMDGTVTEMDMDEYLVGVVSAEMPASFEPEALKAQAIVARTYTQKAITTGGKHGDGSVCTDSSCCQAYLNEEEYRKKGGTEENLKKLRSAVSATSGWVLTYEGELIEATYFSCSGGSTEDAVAVWGTDVPYLRATASPGEENAAHYTDSVYFTKEEFASKLGISDSGNPESWLGYTSYTSGGGISTMVIGGKEFKGTELRQLLGLRSTSITMSTDAEGVTVTTRGYGHRVGMSQYGADAMAVGGSTYDEILAWYYQGTTLTRIGTN